MCAVANCDGYDDCDVMLKICCDAWLSSVEMVCDACLFWELGYSYVVNIIALLVKLGYTQVEC